MEDEIQKQLFLLTEHIFDYKGNLGPIDYRYRLLQDINNPSATARTGAMSPEHDAESIPSY